MRGGIASSMLVVAGLLAAACGGTVAGRDRPPDAGAPPTTGPELGRYLPATEPREAPSPPTTASARDDARPIVPATTVRPTTVPNPNPDRDPPVRRPTTTTSATTGTTTVAPSPAPATTVITAPRAPNAPPPVPTYPAYTVRPGLTGESALLGRPASVEVAAAPVLAVKIDNVGAARPQWELDRADVVFEENVEGATRFMALFHSDVPPELGPVRSARTTDIDLLSAMNRPVLAWSGGNPGVTAWIASAADAGLLIDVAAVRSNCYRRESSRRAPHNLLARTACLLDRGAAAGPARPLWAIDGQWTPTVPTSEDSSFEVAMDNMRAGWTWDPGLGLYLRSQNGQPHVTASGVRLSAANVVVVFATHVPSAVDARSPEAITVGEGLAVVHRDGRQIYVNWSRRSADAPFVFRTEAGDVVPLDVGRTFVELARSG